MIRKFLAAGSVLEFSHFFLSPVGQILHPIFRCDPLSPAITPTPTFWSLGTNVAILSMSPVQRGEPDAMRRFIPFFLVSAMYIAGIPSCGVQVYASQKMQNPSGTAILSKQQSQPVVSTPQSIKELEKIRRGIQKIGIGSPATLYLKNGDELHGTISQYDLDTVHIAEVDRRQNFSVNFTDIRKIRSGLGNVNVFTGQRVTQPRKLRLAALIGIVAVLALPVIILATAKD